MDCVKVAYSIFLAMPKETIFLTISLNTPNYEESDYMLSRERYCARHGYVNLGVTDSNCEMSLSARTCAWMRIPLILALQKEYNVIYVDNDVIVSDDCPAVDDIAGAGDGFYIAKGHSGRPNSGVMIVRSDPCVLQNALNRFNEVPPAECRAPYENGHIIWSCTEHPWLELDQRFNNTRSDVGFMIHHTGPNRRLRQIKYAYRENQVDATSKSHLIDITIDAASSVVARNFLAQDWRFCRE